ncbi:MAG: hypothetical protein RIC35_20625 [Marinoscillum sp.]
MKGPELNLGLSNCIVDDVYLNSLEQNPKNRPSLGIALFRSDQKVHDLQLSEIWYKTKEFSQYVTRNGREILIAGGELQNFNLSFRCAYGKYYQINQSLFPKISLGLNPSYQYNNWKPYITDQEFKTIKMSLAIEVIPQLYWLNTSRTSLNLSVPFKLVHFRYQREDNLPAHNIESITSSMEINWLPLIIELKISFSYWLGV